MQRDGRLVGRIVEEIKLLVMSRNLCSPLGSSFVNTVT